jgi:hypothetical protein
MGYISFRSGWRVETVRNSVFPVHTERGNRINESGAEAPQVEQLFIGG